MAKRVVAVSVDGRAPEFLSPRYAAMVRAIHRHQAAMDEMGAGELAFRWREDRRRGHVLEIRLTRVLPGINDEG